MSQEMKKSKKPIVLIGVIIAIVAIMAIVIITQLNGKSSVEEDDSQGTVQEIISQEGFEIETPYATLSYPTKWKDQVRVENNIEGDVYTVSFYATISGKDELPIFDIAFGGTEGFVVGYIETEDKGKVAVNIVFKDLSAAEGWSQEEYDTICIMQEDVNYIIMTLTEAGILISEN